MREASLIVIAALVAVAAGISTLTEVWYEESCAVDPWIFSFDIDTATCDGNGMCGTTTDLAWRTTCTDSLPSYDEMFLVAYTYDDLRCANETLSFVSGYKAGVCFTQAITSSYYWDCVNGEANYYYCPTSNDCTTNCQSTAYPVEACYSGTFFTCGVSNAGEYLLSN